MDHRAFSRVRDPKHLICSFKKRAKGCRKKDGKIYLGCFRRDIHRFDGCLLSTSYHGYCTGIGDIYSCYDSSEVSDTLFPDGSTF